MPGRNYQPATPYSKFLSVDPLSKNFPWMSPYHFAGNTPIQAIDLEGAEILNKVFVMVDEQGTTFLTNPNGSKVVEITNNNPWSGQKDVKAYFVKKKGSDEFTFYDSKNPGDAEAKMRADGVKFGKPKITEQMLKAPKVNKEVDKAIRTMKNYVTAVMLPITIRSLVLNPKNIVKATSAILDADELVGGATEKDSYIESQISSPEGKAAFNGVKAVVDMTGRTSDVLGLDEYKGGSEAVKSGASIIKGTADVADDATSVQENLKGE